MIIVFKVDLSIQCYCKVKSSFVVKILTFGVWKVFGLKKKKKKIIKEKKPEPVILQEHFYVNIQPQNTVRVDLKYKST